MRTRVLHLFALLCLWPLAAGAEDGGAFDPTIIPGEAKWVFHLDMVAFRSTELGTWATRHAEQPRIKAKLDMFEAMTGFHPQKHLRALTVGGPDLRKQNAMAYLRGSFDRERLTAIAKGMPGYRSAEYGEHLVHCWQDEGKADQLVFACFAREDLLLLSPRETSIRAALDTQSGVRPSLAESEEAPTIAAGDFFCLALAQDFGDLAGVDPHAAMLRKIRDLSFSVRERENTLHATLSASAANEDDAGKMLEVIEGLHALAALNEDSLDPELVELLQDVTCSGEGRSVSIDLTVPVATVIEAIERSPGYRDVFGDRDVFGE